MMSSGGKQEGPKLFSSRILSRDRSTVANASFRVYYSLGAGTVPFVWESKPGTPKRAVTPDPAAMMPPPPPPPPISPPPSYLSTSEPKAASKRRPSASRPGGGWIISSWLNLKNIRRRSSSPPSPPDHRQQRWIGPDRGVDDEGRRPRRRPTLCFR